MVYLDEMIRKESLMTSEFSEMETPEEIAMKIEEITLGQMEMDKDFMERFPNPTYAVLRLSYLVMSEKEMNQEKLYKMYKEKALLNHLKETQIQAIDFIKREKPKMMKALKIEDENQKAYKEMMNTLKEMAIKEYVEV